MTQPLVFKFRAKVSKTGDFTRPELTLTHLVQPMSQANMLIRMKKRSRHDGATMPPKTMNINRLPANVQQVEGGLISKFRVTF